MIIRRIARVRTRNRMMRLSFLGFWFLGVFCFLGLLYSLRMDFAAVNNYYEENVALANPTVPKLELTSSSNFQRFKQDRWFRIKPFPEVFEDTAYVRNVEVQIIKASSDSFRVTITKFVNGQTKEKANTLASHINFNASQIDTLLIADKSIAITKEDKFRNQHVILTIYVPVGKRIRVDQSFGWSEGVRFGGSWNNNWWDYYDDNNVEHGWEHDIDYVMKSDGLYTLDGVPADEYKRHQRKRQNNQEEINGDNEDQQNRKRELQDELRRIEQQEKADSIQRKKDSASQKTGAQEIEGNSGESTLINRSSKKPVATKLPFIDNFSPLII
jgi:hypothetical protein